MKKTCKILSMLLAVLMMAQMAPLSAIGDAIEADTYEAGELEESTETVIEEETVEPETDAPETEIPEIELPEVEIPDIEIPETDAPGTDAPETEMPEVEFPETEAPETEAPETEAPETEAETVKQGTPLYTRSVQWRNANTVMGGFKTLTNNGTVNYNYIQIRFNMNVSPQSVVATMDGVELDCEIDGFYVYITVELLNGEHYLEVALTGEINTVRKSYWLNVEGTTATDYPELKIEGADAMILGKSNELTVDCDKLDQIAEIQMNINLSTAFKMEGVEFADGIEGMCTWFRGKLTIVAKVSNRDKLNGNTLVTIKIKAPASLASEDNFGWSLEKAEIIPMEGVSFGESEHFVGTMSSPSVEIPIIAGYTVEATEDFTLGGVPYTFIVKKSNGSPAANVSLYVKDGRKNVLLGKTDSEGKLTTTYFNKVGAYQVYAEDDKGINSFLFPFFCHESVGPEDGSPYGLLNSFIPAQGMNFSWMSHVAASDAVAQLKLSTTPEMTDATLYNGTSSVRYYTESMAANRVNSVTVDGLVQGNVYYYQVGDGNVWSEVKSFTVRTNERTGFLILGDMMNSPVSNLALIANAAANDGVDYGLAIRMGSVVPTAGNYQSWENVVNGLVSFGDLPMLHTFGSNNADHPDSFYFKQQSGYSYTVVGDVFIATISYTEDARALESRLYQMYLDVLISETAWQILVIEQSPYTTDAEKANSIFTELVPTYAEDCGIDVVFSAGEGVYARTEGMRGGAVTNKNGVYYVVSGSLGEHGSHIPTGEFAMTDSDYNAVYISVTTDDTTITVTAYNVMADGSVEVIDTFSKTLFVCEEGEHMYAMSGSVDHSYVVCENCLNTVEMSSYVGLVKFLGNYMFMENSNFRTGWIEWYGKTYYISTSNRCAVNGTRTVDGHQYVFEDYVLVEGCWIDDNGVDKLVWAGQILKNTWHTQRGMTYYFMEDGAYAVGEVEIPTVNENGETVYETYVFDQYGALIGKKDAE